MFIPIWLGWETSRIHETSARRVIWTALLYLEHQLRGLHLLLTIKCLDCDVDNKDKRAASLGSRSYCFSDDPELQIEDGEPTKQHCSSGRRTTRRPGRASGATGS